MDSAKSERSGDEERAYRGFGGWLQGLRSTDNREKLIVKLEQSGHHADRNIQWDLLVKQGLVNTEFRLENRN